MATTENHTHTTVETGTPFEERNGSSIETEKTEKTSVEKKSASHEDRNDPYPDIERARSDVDQHPPMTFKRFMAIFTLGCLLAAAQIPIYLIGGGLCKSPL
jgi:hypothetical protein